MHIYIAVVGIDIGSDKNMYHSILMFKQSVEKLQSTQVV